MPDDSRRWGRAIVWFRRDLRVHDHPALAAAVAGAREVIPTFVIDERLTSVSPARTCFLLASLAELEAALRHRGSGLVVRRGDAVTVIPALAAQFDADVVLCTRDVTAFSHRRDQAIKLALAKDGRQYSARPGLLLAEPEDLLATSGRSYSVFTPFWRALQGAAKRDVLAAPPSIPTSRRVAEASSLSSSDLVEHQRDMFLPIPGERAARERLREWAASGITGYGEGRDRMSGDSTSRLGPDLHFGLVSPREVEAAVAQGGPGSTPFLRQLAWREFYHHRSFAERHAANATGPHPIMSVVRSEHDDPDAVAAWRAGRTGVPPVDAAMRQLAASGWMSNRARLVVASFLTKHLLMDYRIGERHFMAHLIDGDVANNRGGWQWTAGVGADAQPFFRIFNPVLQGRRFDPDGSWIRRWLPELTRVPDRYVHAPWEMPIDEAQDVGFSLGESYPAPIVDLAAARARALGAFQSLKT